MEYPEKCPSCNSNWIAGEIPEKDREHYGNGKYFYRVVYVKDLYDRKVRYYQCPDCAAKFDNFDTEER